MSQNTYRENPLFSIVISVLNGADEIQDCLDSIVSQSFPDYEIVVIDGGSADRTVDILEQYDSYIEKWISEPDTGIYNAWNKALNFIRGEWVLYLGADDLLYSKNVLSEVSERLLRIEKEFDIAYGQVAVVDADGKTLQIKGGEWSSIERGFWHTMTLPHQGVFHRRKMLLDIGAFDESFRIAADYDLLLQTLKKHPPFFLQDIVVARWKIGGISYNPETALQVAAEFSTVRRKNNLSRISLPLTVFYLKALVLKILVLVGGAKLAETVAWKWRVLKGEWQG